MASLAARQPCAISRFRTWLLCRIRIGRCARSSCLALSALVIAAAWAWLGAPVPMPQRAAGSRRKAYCVSYAPFRGRQTPLDPTTHMSAAQIERGSDAARQAHRLRAHLFDRFRTGPDRRHRRPARAEGACRDSGFRATPIKNRQQIENAVVDLPTAIRTRSAPWWSATRCCCAAKCRATTSPPPSARSRRGCRCR